MLETGRLALRPPGPDDLDALHRVFGDAEAMRHVAWGRAWSREETAALLERMRTRLAEDGFGQLIVEERESGRAIGRCGLLPLDPETWRPRPYGEGCEVEIGWTLAREAWGRGYATEAALAVRDDAQERLGLRRLVSIVQVGNERSVRVVEKLGGRAEREIVTAFGRPAVLYAYGDRLRP